MLAFGCHNLTGGSSLQRSVRLVHCAIDHGITDFDVAPPYGMGTAESVLGRAIKQRGQGVKVTTKFGIEPPRFGRVLSWAREPYRWLRKMVGQAKPISLNAAIQASGSSRLLSSLERSLRALSADHVDTLLTHERVDHTRQIEYLGELAQARKRGMLAHFGCSGQRDAVLQSLSTFSGYAEIVQVSVQDAATFESRPHIRLFGAVRLLRPQIERQAGIDRSYRDALMTVLPGVASHQERFALGALAVARVLFPHSTLLFNTSNESHVERVVRYLGDRSLTNWVSEFRATHNQMVFESAAA